MKHSALLLIILLLVACSREVPEGIVELVYASPYPPSHPFSQADQEWMDFVAQRSQGSLRIVPNWSGALISSEHSMQELRHGVADIGLITPIYVKGGAHLIRLQSGFYSGTTTVEAQVALYRCLANDNAQFAKELEGLQVLAVQGGSLPGIITRDRPVQGLADLQGLRLRAPTELISVLRELGADPVNMPMADVYSSLAKGVLDGVVAPLDTFQSLHFAEVTNYYAGFVIPRGAYPARAMGQRRWQALSVAHRQVLEEGTAIWEAALSRRNVEALEIGRLLALDQGVNFTTVAASEQQRFDAMYLDFAARNAASLSAYGIDGISVFASARASVRSDGSVICSGGTL